MVSKKLEDEFTKLQLDTEDIVIETWVMLKKKYDGMMRKVLDVIALWWIHNDIKNLTDAQSHIDSLMAELDGILDPANEQLIEDMTKLFAQVYEFNAEYAKKALEIEDDEDYLLMFSLLGLASIPWAEDELTYTERMKLRNNQLKDAIKTIVLRSSVMGNRGSEPKPVSTKKLLDEIEKEINKGKYRGTNVVIDESNHFANEAVKKVAIEKYGGYEISGVLDSRQCDFCRSMHGKRFLWSEYNPGITAPTWHVSCRCRIIPIDKLRT